MKFYMQFNFIIPNKDWDRIVIYFSRFSWNLVIKHTLFGPFLCDIDVRMLHNFWYYLRISKQLIFDIKFFKINFVNHEIWYSLKHRKLVFWYNQVYKKTNNIFVCHINSFKGISIKFSTQFIYILPNDRAIFCMDWEIIYWYMAPDYLNK